MRCRGDLLPHSLSITRWLLSPNSPTQYQHEPPLPQMEPDYKPMQLNWDRPSADIGPRKMERSYGFLNVSPPFFLCFPFTSRWIHHKKGGGEFKTPPLFCFLVFPIYSPSLLWMDQDRNSKWIQRNLEPLISSGLEGEFFNQGAITLWCFMISIGMETPQSRANHKVVMIYLNASLGQTDLHSHFFPKKKETFVMRKKYSQ